MFLPLNDTVEEERMTVGINMGEVVDVSIGEGGSFRNMIEDDGRQGFVYMQPGNFAETGKTSYGNIFELVNMRNLVRIT